MSSYFDNGGFIGVSAPFGTKFSRIIENGLQLWLDASNPQSYGPENFVPYSVDITPSTSPDWISFNSLSTTATTGVDGQNDAFTLTDSDSTNYAGVYITNDNPSVYETVQTMTAICHVKKNTGGPWAYIDVYFQDTPSFTNGSFYTVSINPENGDLGINTGLNAEVTLEGDWWRVIFEVQTDGAPYDRVVFVLYPATAPAGPSYVGDPTATGSNTFWNPQLQRGTKSNYRRPVKTTGSVIKREERWYNLVSDTSNMILVNSPTYSNTNNGVLKFNGANQYGYNTLNYSTQSFTIMAASRYSGATRGRVVTSNTNNWLFGHHNNKAEVYYAEGWLTPVSGPNDENWRIFAGVENYGADQRSFYVNNEVKVSNSTAGSQGFNGLAVGAWVPGGPSEYSSCEVSCILVYNRLLSTDEMTQNYNALRGRFGL
jgi:hypothetical protein